MIIRWMFLTAFIVVSSIGFFWAMRDRRRFFQFPSMIALCMLLYMVPQAVVAVMNERFVPTDACCLTLFHGTNCIFLAYMGYFQYQTPPLRQRVRYDSKRVFQVGAFWTIMGVIGYLALDLYVYGGFLEGYSFDKGRYTIEFTGLPVQLTYVSRLVLPGIMLIMMSMMAQITFPRVMMLLIALFYPILDVVVGGRRYMLAMLGGSFIFPFVAFRRWSPPFWLVTVGVVMMVAATVIMPAVRYDVGIDKGFGALLKIDLADIFAEHYRADEVELPYHMLAVSAVLQTNWYGYGIDFYNALIKQYIPRTLVGEEIKSRYYLPGTQPETAMATVGMTGGKTYLAEPGIVDSFFQFSFAGCLLFFFTGRTFRHIWDRAMIDRDIRFMLAFCLFSWVPPYIVYGGFLSTMNRSIPMLVVFFSANWYAQIRATAPVISRRKMSTTSSAPSPTRPTKPTRRPGPRRRPGPGYRPGTKPVVA